MSDIEKQDFQNVLESIDINEIKGKKFLVAGATSFLGSSIINTLIYYNEEVADSAKDQCTIYGLYHDQKKIDKKFGNRFDKQNLIFVQWDATDPKEDISINDDVDYVFYLCGIAVTSQFTKRPVDTMLLNTIGLNTILRFSELHNVKSFLFFSSGAVYGNLSGITRISENDRFPMDHLDISNVYGEGKRAAETLCNSYFIERGLPIKIVRISHTYGPGIDLNDGRVFSDFIKCIAENKNLVIRGDGTASRPFCYISDALKAFFLIILKGENGQAYNMANTYETYTISELAEKLVNDAFPDKELSVEYCKGKPKGEGVKPYVDIKRLCELGWKPTIEVTEGFGRTVICVESR